MVVFSMAVSASFLSSRLHRSLTGSPHSDTATETPPRYLPISSNRCSSAATSERGRLLPSHVPYRASSSSDPLCGESS